MLDDKESVGVTGPGGFGATATGVLTPVLFVIALGFGLNAYFAHTEAVAANSAHDRLENQVQRMADGIDVQNWLLSMPQDKRPRLLKPFAADRFIEDRR